MLRLIVGYLAPICLALFLGLNAGVARAQTTAFTYQGKLADNNMPVTGNYDFEFKLFDTAAVGSGTQQGATLQRLAVAVSGGIFTVQLDFGACASCFNGAARFLEIAVKPTSGSTFITLGPRQPISTTPYAIRSLSATAADGLSIACVNCVTSSQIQSVQGSQVTGALPVGSVPAGSGNYIQNTTTQQAASNFSISGDGTAAGTLSANAVNVATQYNFGGLRVLGVTGSASFTNSNLFLGVGAGQANAPNGSNGVRNTFAGSNAGAGNTTGFANSFFGALAGEANLSGDANSFFGRGTGQQNQTGGENAFFGAQAGILNVSGSRNTYIGSAAGGSDGLTNASAFGYRAFATQSNALVLGSINGVNGATVDTNVGIGTTAPSARLHVVGDGLVTGNLTVNGTMNANLSSNIVNATTQYNLGGLRVLGVSGSNTNLFVGIGAGPATTTGVSNSFFGRDAGLSNTTGSQNSFFGLEAGKLNSAGTDNAFFGTFAGKSNVTGVGNSFFGSSAGEKTTAGFNSFFGNGAGYENTTGTGNSFFGSNAGQNNTASDNSFFGREAGYLNTVGTMNSFFGQRAGRNNTGSGNAFFGFQAGLANTTSGQNSFFGSNAGQNNTTGLINAFFGYAAGTANTSGSENSFFGNVAGLHNTTGIQNSFFGNAAGSNNETGGGNSFFGKHAGVGTITGGNNSFFGRFAGSSNATGSNNTMLGNSANVGSGDLTNATAIGNSAQVNQSNSLVLGSISGVNGATASVNVGIGTPSPQAPLHLQRDGIPSNNWQSAQLRISGNTDPNMQLNLGYDTTSNRGVIQAGHANVAFKDLLINPFGGNIGIGTTNPTAKLTFEGSISGNFSNPLAYFNNTNATGNSGPTLRVAASGNAVDGVLNVSAFGTGKIAAFGSTAGGGEVAYIDVNGNLAISGNGTLGGTLSANQVNVTTRFNLNGNRVFEVTGGAADLNSNTFAGVGAGAANQPGGSSSGNRNSFFGSNAGLNNTTGFSNSFFGRFAGSANIQGSGNSFFGAAADGNVTGGNNTLIGYSARLGSDNLINATALGALAQVGCDNCLVLGSINGINAATASVKVGIGTASPESLLHVRGASPLRILADPLTLSGSEYVDFMARSSAFASDLGGLRIQRQAASGNIDTLIFAAPSGSAASERMRITGTGNVGIGVSAPTFQLQLSSDSAAKPNGGSWSNPSDRRLKENIRPFTDGLAVLKQINPVSYRLNGKGGLPKGEPGIGVIAQEVRDILPYTITTFKAKLEAGDAEPTTLLAFNSSALTFVLVNAVKELSARLDALRAGDQQAEIDALKRENEAQKQRLTDLERRLAAMEQAMKKLAEKP